jgi:hypothetical protein
MEISSKPTLLREQKAVSLPLYKYHEEFPTFPDTFDNQLLPLLFLPSKVPVATSTEALAAD